jgi:hypothetical protein
MATIKFTSSIIKKGKGSYIARADEFAIAAGPATTQRGAIKKLKIAVLAKLRRAAEAGKLMDLFDDAGYNGSLLHFSKSTSPLECHPFTSDTVLLPVPRSLAPTAKRNRVHNKKQ